LKTLFGKITTGKRGICSTKYMAETFNVLPPEMDLNPKMFIFLSLPCSVIKMYLWKVCKQISMIIYRFAALAILHMGAESEVRIMSPGHIS
jgi:hypothetical protein